MGFKRYRYHLRYLEAGVWKVLSWGTNSAQKAKEEAEHCEGIEGFQVWDFVARCAISPEVPARRLRAA